MQFLTAKQARKLAASGSFDPAAVAVLSDDPDLWLELSSRFPDSAQISRERADRAMPLARKRALDFASAVNSSKNSKLLRHSTVGGMNVVSSDLYRKFVELEVLLNLQDDQIKLAVISCPSVAFSYSFEKQTSLGLGWKLRLFFKFAKNFSKAILRALYSTFRLVADKLLVSISDPRIDGSKEFILLRTWVTKGCFVQKVESYQFLDRNFGVLSKRLSDLGHDVLLLPMFFNLAETKTAAFKKFKKSNAVAINYFKYTSFKDLLSVIAFAWLEIKLCFAGFDNIDVGTKWLFRTSHSRYAASPQLLELALSGYSLKHFSSRGMKVLSIAYPFENNPSEQMLLDQIQSLPMNITTVGFQHSPWYQEQYSMQYEFVSHQGGKLPTKIFSSNEASFKSLKISGWPESKLFNGPNLRFARNDWPTTSQLARNSKFKLGIVLSYDDKSSKIMLGSLLSAISLMPGANDIEVTVRRHPLNGKELLTKFPFQIDNSQSVEKFVLGTQAIMMASASVSNLEVLALDRPLIRWTNPVEFDLDSLGQWREKVYNVTSSAQIKNAIQQLRADSPRHNSETVNEVRREYFTPLDERALQSLVNSLTGGN